MLMNHVRPVFTTFQNSTRLSWFILSFENVWSLLVDWTFFTYEIFLVALTFVKIYHWSVEALTLVYTTDISKGFNEIILVE